MSKRNAAIAIAAVVLVGLVTCGIGAVVWGIIDAVLIFTDKVRDTEGRPLREGT